MTYSIEEVESSRAEEKSFSEEHDEDIGFTQDEGDGSNECC